MMTSGGCSSGPQGRSRAWPPAEASSAPAAGVLCMGHLLREPCDRCAEGSFAVASRSRATGCYAQSVAVGIFKVTLPSSQTGFVHWDAEFERDGVDVANIEMDEGVRACVAFVLGEVDADPAACD